MTAVTAAPGTRREQWRPWLIAAAALLLTALVYVALRQLLQQVHYADVVRQIAAQPLSALAWSALATAVSYLVLTGYDVSALEYAGVSAPRRTVLLTSFIAYALGNSVGLGVLTGGAVRMRLYLAAGIDAARIAQAAAFNAVAFFVGMTAFAAAGLMWGAPQASKLLHVPPVALRGLGCLLLLAVAAFILLCARRRELRIGPRRRLLLPPPGLALRQLAISAADLSASAAALWVLLPGDVIGLPAFFAWYAMAVALGLVSHVPGGLGVFEAVILFGCSTHAQPGQIVGALVLYRVIYYLLPLVLAAMLLAVYELRTGIAAPLARAASAASPLLLATLTFIAGGWLLVSGVTPASSEATDLLAMHVPLPLVEASHFIGSVAGFAMLVVARGLLHRLDAAWWTAFLLAIVAAVLALPKGIALTEASYLTLLAFLLVSSRKHFRRRSALFSQWLTPQWLLAVAWVVGVCVLLLLFVYRQVDYHQKLWWQFEFDAHAPRSLRAMMGVALAGLAVALWRLLRPAPGAPALPTPSELQHAARIVAAQPFADACLVQMGDKHLLFSQSGRSFLMYARQGRSWVSLFDPIGECEEAPELVWRFIELADRHGGRAAFYQVRPEGLAMYLDAGLRAFKLGEYAYVPLAPFTLKGSKRAALRQAVNRAGRDGLRFALLAPEQVRGVMSELGAVSQEWLAGSRTREKGFSLGAFVPEYIAQQPVAIVCKEQRIIAFANVLCTTVHREVSVDLMRHCSTAPGGTMDFLFVQLMLHFRAQGYERFGLGMATLSGMAAHALAPRWHRFGRLLFDYGENFYNFRGLRSFKEKFDPVWEPRYFAAPGGAASLLALADTATLIGGGLKGVIAK